MIFRKSSQNPKDAFVKGASHGTVFIHLLAGGIMDTAEVAVRLVRLPERGLRISEVYPMTRETMTSPGSYAASVTSAIGRVLL
jgi:hypothetical protein